MLLFKYFILIWHQSRKIVLQIIIRNITVIAGFLMIVIALIIDITGNDSIMFELVGYIVLIASACTLAKREAYMIDFGIGILSGLLTIVWMN